MSFFYYFTFSLFSTSGMVSHLILLGRIWRFSAPTVPIAATDLRQLQMAIETTASPLQPPHHQKKKANASPTTYMLYTYDGRFQS